MRRHPRAHVGMIAVVGMLVLGLAACGGGPSTANTSGTPNGTSGTSATTPGTSSNGGSSVVPTAPPIPTTPQQDQLSPDFCANPADVQTQLPSSLPSYPGANLHVSETTNGNSLFGYCTSASVSDVASFYQKQLPGKGWSNVSMTTISFLQQITATQTSGQDSFNLTISVEPSATLSNTTEVLVILLKS